MLHEFDKLVAEFEKHQVRYLICGGLAVVAHGHMRSTHDINLIMAMDTDNLLKGLHILEALDFRPSLPVTIEQFANPVIRREWETKRNLKVLSFLSSSRPPTVVDIFSTPPFDFDTEWNRAKITSFGKHGNVCRFVSLQTLITMKHKAGRGIDLDDIKNLEKTNGK